MEINKSIEIMKALADSSRLQALNAIMEKPQYVEEIANRLNLAVSTVSFHLKKLENAGLISKRKEQYYVMYSINEELLRLSLRELTSCRNIEKYIQDERMEKYRGKVLKAFYKKGKLTALPVQRKKKMIILNEFIKQFKSGIRYSETEVNDLIKQSYDDYCTIRRLMIEEGLVKRENQIYWLNIDKEEKND